MALNAELRWHQRGVRNGTSDVGSGTEETRDSLLRPFPKEPYTKGNQLIDYFEFDRRARKYVANTLSSS
jgi:hypothetical protein